MPSSSSRARRAFTLVELLVVIGIIALLISILMPALSKSRQQAIRVQCASNLRQWGIGLAQYIGANKGYFPYNGPAILPNCPLGGKDMSWNSTVVQQFFTDYLIKNKAVTERQGDNVLYCPTQDWHREAQNDPTGNGGLAGYFYLPFREPGLDPSNTMNYAPTGFADGKEWVAKKKPAARYRAAPIASDMLQYNASTKSWARYTSHIKGNTPVGGNFLFEDGRVTWYDEKDDPSRPNKRAIDLGSTLGDWQCYYRVYDADIPNNM
jgi:prepilin-type N-terminal cleavage/methylation domain-containing protein